MEFDKDILYCILTCGNGRDRFCLRIQQFFPNQISLKKNSNRNIYYKENHSPVPNHQL